MSANQNGEGSVKLSEDKSEPMRTGLQAEIEREAVAGNAKGGQGPYISETMLDQVEGMI